MNQLIAQTLCNPALATFGGCGGGGAADSGNLLALLIATLWRTLMILGGILVLIFLIWGGISWLTSGGDEARVEAAKNRIVNALVGMTILFASAAIVAFISAVFDFNLLNPEFTSNLP